MVGKKEKNTVNCEMGQKNWVTLGGNRTYPRPEPTWCGATTEQLPLDDGMELKYWNRQWHSKYEFV
jgi:hypothetical protein